jgi:hypothetical protein
MPLNNNVGSISVQGETILGVKSGLEIYYYGSDDIRIKPGVVDVDGNYIKKTSESELSGESSLTGWNFITVDTSGNISVRSATGTSSQRPTDSCYQFANYDHDKQGYYYDSDERIIGAIYRVSGTTWYVVNNEERADEQGQNLRGNWDICGDSLRQYGLQTFDTAISTSTGVFYVSGELAIIYPIPFLDVPAMAAMGNTLNSDWSFLISMGNTAGTATTGYVYLYRGSADSTVRTRRVYYQAVGHWNPF